MADTSYKKLLTVNETKAGQGLVSSSLELLRLSSTTSYELDDFSLRAPDVEPKWTAKPQAICATLGQRLATWTQQTLRNFRLLLLMTVGPWKKRKEQPKIALYTGWVPVLTGLLVHVLPLAACVTLIYLNVTSYFVSTNVSALTFQFLAKFLELLAQASLGSAVFVYLRALYTGPESVPFGALFAGLQITSVSYLWSLEFAGVVTSKSFKRTTKCVFFLLIPLSVAIAAGIGPSFAIALTPTPGAFYNGWAEEWIYATEEQIFSSNIHPGVLDYNTSEDCHSGYCARYGWEAAMTVAQLDRQLPYVKYDVQQSSFDLTQDALPYREIRWNASVGSLWLSATVTIPSKIIAWSLSSLAYQACWYTSLWSIPGDQNYTTTTRQPTVTVNCTRARWLNLTSVQTESGWGDGSPHFVYQSELLRSFNETQSFHWMFIDRDDSVTQPPSQVNPSIWALVHYPSSSLDFTDSYINGSFGLCAIYAGYGHVQNTVLWTMSASPWSGNLVSSQTNSPSTSIINIPAIWLNQTLPPLSTLVDNLLGVHTTTFIATSLAFSMAQWPKQVLNYPSIPEFYPYVPEYKYWPDSSIIVRPNSTLSDQLVNPSFQVLGSRAGDHVFYAGSEYADAEGKYKLRTDVSTQGYGYHLDQRTKTIAVSVLAAYCLYISIFVVLMLTLNRVHSNAWDSIGELTALAIMSRPDEKLRNTSAGIETVALFKLPMNIRANDKNHLEILFEDDSEISCSGVVEKNKKYN